MYFQLLQGCHKEIDGTKYESIVTKKDDRGRPLEVFQPVLTSNSDLVKNFGNEQFRALSKEEYETLLKKQNKKIGVLEKKANTPIPETDLEEMEEAVKKGAKDILPVSVLGKNVTSRFPDAIGMGLEVHISKDDRTKYLVVKKGTEELVSKNPLEKDQVEDFIDNYSEE